MVGSLVGEEIGSRAGISGKFVVSDLAGLLLLLSSSSFTGRAFLTGVVEALSLSLLPLLVIEMLVSGVSWLEVWDDECMPVLEESLWFMPIMKAG